MCKANYHFYFLSGSFPSIANPTQRQNMRDTMNYTLTGSYAGSLAGKTVWELVDILTIHYPVGDIAVLEEIYNEYLASGKVESIWITEEHGNKGTGPVSVLNRSFRFIQWAASHNLTAWQTR